jgi:hypothetical protein
MTDLLSGPENAQIKRRAALDTLRQVRYNLPLMQ